MTRALTAVVGTPSPGATTDGPSLLPEPPEPGTGAWGWLVSFWDWFVGLPLQIAIIVLVGGVVLLVLRRVIASATDRLAAEPSGTTRGTGRPRAGVEVASVLRKASPLATARRAQRARTVGSVLTSTASIVVGSLVVLLVLDKLNVNLAPFIASAGIVGVAVGFGAQSLVKDFLSGLFMLLEDQYGVGDVVDVGDVVGSVEAVGLRVTKVRDGDGTLWYVPNGSMVRVGNKTQGFGTAVVEVDVDYFVDLDEVRGLLAQAARGVAADPVVGAYLQGEPEVTGAEKLAADAVGLRLSVRTAPAMQWEVARHLRAAVRRALEDAGVPLAGQRDALVAHQERLAGAAPTAVPSADGDDPATGGAADDAARDAAAHGSGPQGSGSQGPGSAQGSAARDPHDTPVHDVVERRDPPPPVTG